MSCHQNAEKNANQHCILETNRGRFNYTNSEPSAFHFLTETYRLKHNFT